MPIPDEPGPVATSTINIAGAGAYVCDVNVTVNITHTFSGDLDITLQSPSGKIVTLSTDNGGSNDNVFAGTTFDDQANPGGQVPYATNAGLVTDHPYANLVVARQYNVLGEPSLAMAALQRRSFMRGWPRYRATGLKLQVSLALALRDSAKAKSAADRLEATSR